MAGGVSVRTRARRLAFATALAGAALVSCALASCALASCAEARPPVAKVAPVEVGYGATLDPRAPVLLLVRPALLRRDEVFGPLVSALSRLAATRGVTGSRELEAFESAEELVIAVDESSDAAPGAALLAPTSGVIALGGVRADLVPEKLLDGDGKLLFRSGRPRGAVTEHEGYAEDPLALFVLPRRTWVVAFGGAVTRSRAALADGRPRPPPAFDADALLELRLDGPRLVARVPRLERGELGIGRRLDDARIILRPGRGGLTLVLTYADDDAAAWAENTLTRVVRAFSRRLEGALAWLGDATVAREGRSVRARVAVPARVVEVLKGLDVRDLLESFDAPPGDAGAGAAPRGDAGASVAPRDASW